MMKLVQPSVVTTGKSVIVVSGISSVVWGFGGFNLDGYSELGCAHFRTQQVVLHAMKKSGSFLTSEVAKPSSKGATVTGSVKGLPRPAGMSRQLRFGRESGSGLTI